MVRAVLGVIGSYILMFILAFAAFTCAYVVLGADQAFRPHSFQASKRWILMSYGIQLVVGVVGGFVCALIAKGGKAPLVLAGVVLVLGIALNAVALAVKPVVPDQARPANVPMMEAMQKAKLPVWVPFTYPIMGAIGVLVGGSLKKKKA